MHPVELEFDMLGSGSTGNCGLIAIDGTVVLVDAGFSCKRIGEMLAGRNISPDSVSAVFITHEHLDHIQGLRGLRKRGGIEFFTNAATAVAIEKKFGFGIPWQTFSTGDPMKFRGLSITSFSVPHDAADPIGYVFSAGDSASGQIRSVAWMTDLGYIPSHIPSYVSSVDLLVIESNYDEMLLEVDTKRPYYIKDRIRGRLGHLANEAAINFIKNNKPNQWKKVILAHVSSDCNSEACIKKLLGDTAEFDFEIDIARP